MSSPLLFCRGLRPVLLQTLLILVAGCWVFAPAFHGDWLWDDHLFITDNPLISDPAGLWKIWFEPGRQVDYYPLEQTVLWLEWHLWRNDTLGYHLVSVVLHLVSALLVWRLFDKLGLRLAWLGGLLFTIHPVQVESVAWIVELKNTLSLPPFLLAMCAWIDYDRLGKQRDYFLALGLFLIAMLCKIAVVMFPAVILLYAWWRRDRVGWNDLKASAPFFIVSLTLGLITILSGVWDRLFNHLGPEYAPAGGVMARLVLAGQEIVFYFSKSVLPVELLPVYPKWPVDPSSPVQYLPWVVWAGLIGWLWTKRPGWGRHALLGLGFFLINLAPCPGFIPAPNMGYAWVMDHFLYLPIIGLIGILVAGHIYGLFSPKLRLLSIGMTAAVIALLAFEGHRYAQFFINEETFWKYTLDRNPGSAMPHADLGDVLLHKGRTKEAMEQFELALQIDPGSKVARNDLGYLFWKQSRLAEAKDQFEQALAINPGDVMAHDNLSNILFEMGRYPEAIEQSREALKLNPEDASSQKSLGNALLQTGRVEEAIDHYRAALKINPNYAEAHNGLGNALLNSGRLTEAMSECQEALKLNPDYADAHGTLGLILARASRLPEAIEQLETARRLSPNHAAFDKVLATLREQLNAPTKNR